MNKTSKLALGATGIYFCFLLHGIAYEDLLSFRTKNGARFDKIWFLQTVSALCNCLVSGFAMLTVAATSKQTPPHPPLLFAKTGAVQFLAHACTSLAITKGVSAPVVILAKSAKMVPVMLGAWFFNPKICYSLRSIVQAALIVGGTIAVGFGERSHDGQQANSSVAGVLSLVAALCCDGYVGGKQKEAKDAISQLSHWHVMFFTNLSILVLGCAVSIAIGDGYSGAVMMVTQTDIAAKILSVSICSAFGQVFIFFIITNFDSVCLTSITTTRKVMSVLLSIYLYGHILNALAWTGVMTATLGIIGEMHDRITSTENEKKLE